MAPNFKVIRETIAEATRLHESGDLTMQRLDELEKKADDASDGFGQVLEPFEDLRDQLLAVEREAERPPA